MIFARAAACIWLLAAQQFANAAPVASSREMQFASLDAERRLAEGLSGQGTGAANQHLDAVFQRLLAAAADPDLTDCRVYLLKGARPSVFALPHCRLYLSTALFMTLDNEAQITALLARELTHVEYAHAQLEGEERMRKVDSLHILSIALGAAFWTAPQGHGVSRSTEATSDLIWRVSIAGYSHERESSADVSGVRRLRAAGFELADALLAYERVRSLCAGEPSGRVPRLSDPAYLEQRLASLASLGPPGEAAAPDPSHAALVAGLRLEQVELLWRARALDEADRMLAQHVASSGESGRSHWLAAEIARANAAPIDAVLAAYERGSSFADAPAGLFLEWGMLLRQQGLHERAQTALQKFLDLAPESADAAFIRIYLQNRQGEGE